MEAEYRCVSKGTKDQYFKTAHLSPQPRTSPVAPDGVELHGYMYIYNKTNVLLVLFKFAQQRVVSA